MGRIIAVVVVLLVIYFLLGKYTRVHNVFSRAQATVLGK